MIAKAGSVVVGAGIAGLSTALFLRRETGDRVVVFDAATPGSGASGHGSGIIRVHHSDPNEMLLAESGASIYRDWVGVIGGPDIFSRRGLAWLVGQSDADLLKRNVRKQQALDLSVQLLSSAAVADIFPGIEVADLAGAAFEPDGGSVVGREVMTALTCQAVGEGVELRTFEPVKQLLVSDGRVRGVETETGLTESSVVVAAAGAWTRNLLLGIGLDLPIHAIRATLGTVYLPPELRGLPAFFDEVNDASFVPKSDGTAVVSARDDGHLIDVDPNDFNTTCSLDAAEHGRALVARRLPAVSKAPLASRWAAADGCTPDGRAVIGAVSSVEGLYVNAGGNFKGIKVGPGAGSSLAQLIVGGQAPPHFHAVRPDRFFEDPFYERAATYANSRWC